MSTLEFLCQLAVNLMLCFWVWSAHGRIDLLRAKLKRLEAWSRPPKRMCEECGTGFATDEHQRIHKCGVPQIRV